MIWVDHKRDPEFPEWADIIIDGKNFSLTIDDLEWIRDMCLEPAIRMLTEAPDAR